MKNNLIKTRENYLAYPEIVTWEENFSTGIELVDKQHRELVDLTNHLYQACIAGNDQMDLDLVFKDTMSHMVEYVRCHFTAEQELMKRVNYPNYDLHKMQHDYFIKRIIVSAADYESGRKFAPNIFVRTLKDWVYSHIALYDKSYADYVADQRQRGLLPDECLACRLSVAPTP